MRCAYPTSPAVPELERKSLAYDGIKVAQARKTNDQDESRPSDTAIANDKSSIRQGVHTTRCSRKDDRERSGVAAQGWFTALLSEYLSSTAIRPTTNDPMPR